MELIALFTVLLGGAALVGWGGDEEAEPVAEAPTEDEAGDLLPSLLDEDEAPIRLALSDAMGAEIEVAAGAEGATVTADGEAVLGFPGLTAAEAASRMEALDAAGAFARG